ncbi:MAG: amidohydrolase family protein [Gammaproteobacteria bacterium]|nr:amidohydrolase family protein [Gammaproteobacteria bacterium]
MYDLLISNADIVDGSGAARFRGDVAVKDGRIVAVARQRDGGLAGRARRRIDAEGRLLTPGFVDIHTHYDGQVCWDKQVTPSCWHGVTTMVMGNCGVGFAPVRPGTENELVELMEAVEDIPGTALHEGIPWGWETFAEYLDFIDTPYAMDVGAQVPHVALRHYVMGSRCYDDATPQDIARMAALTTQALKDGALGFSTSRFYGHIDKHGNVVPGTHADVAELKALGEAVAAAPHGTIEIISDRVQEPEEQRWIEWIARRTRRPVTMLVTSNIGLGALDMAVRLNAEGLQVRPQVGARPASVLMTLEGTLNPMRRFPAYAAIRHLPFDEQRQRLLDPAFRAQILADTPKVARYADTDHMISAYDEMYVLPAELSYEPSASDSVAAIARARGVDCREALMDVMASGRPLLHLVGEYRGDLETQRRCIQHPESVFGLGDGGAHCGVLCDASLPTYMLAYMCRDRTRGARLELEFTVHKMTRDTALLYGIADRGLIAPGYRADLNVIDFDALALTDPEMVYDLPAGGRRFVQKAHGFVATVCAGEVTYEDGEHTGALPGRLLRGAIAAP